METVLNEATKSPIARVPEPNGFRANQTIATIIAMMICTKSGSVKPVNLKSLLELSA